MNTSPPTPASGRIDTHHHIVPPFYRNWLQDKGITAGGKAIPEWTVDAALELMDITDVATAILSVSTPGVEPGVLHEARSMARQVNDYAATVAAENPGRFGFFATVPLPDIDGSIAEAGYALDVLDADGVVLLSNTRGVYLGDAQYLPLMEYLNNRHAVVFVHPSALPAVPVDGIPPYVADFLLDTTRAAINLAKTGTIDRFPNIKFILSHAGGFLPFAAARVAVGASPTGESADGLRLLRRFYFDTALSASESALPSLTAFADPNRILYGSDFPYAPAERSRTFTAALDAYPAIDHAAVNHVNAGRLFPRFTRVRSTSDGVVEAGKFP
ncbi:amidohydrolase [Rhodococcus fascians]|nr:amidohydrolase [Rhodococcus fascians]MBY4237877.1 amidohydrolase [Rhodococcus fascians]MBY4253372.1 amidohydrolase [Rhodococcus fascians]MBY4269009.1 amidohydrolase [Rhodococcus fascians]MBY4275062.1 amidohydrolase [Rhodococcus fascians]